MERHLSQHRTKDRSLILCAPRRRLGRRWFKEKRDMVESSPPLFAIVSEGRGLAKKENNTL